MDARLQPGPLRTNLAGPSGNQRKSERESAALVYAARSPWGPFEHGQVQPLQAIRTLGEGAALLLERAGISDTRELWTADAPFLAAIARVRPETADEWRCIAELLAVRGLPDRFAAPLVAAGVASIEDLCSESPTLLLGRLHRHEERHGDPSRRQEIFLADVQECIDAANRHMSWAPSPRASAATEV